MTGDNSNFKLDRRLYQNTKDLLRLLNAPPPRTGFEQAVAALFGEGEKLNRVAKLGDSGFRCSGSAKNMIALLPLEWENEFQRRDLKWNGCEKWWAGYPIILLLEVRSLGARSHSQLRLNAEVGPVAEHQTRQRVIGAIEAAAAAMNLGRISFAPAAKEERNLYARFLNKSSMPLNDPGDPRDVKRSIVSLTQSLRPEIEAISRAISRF